MASENLYFLDEVGTQQLAEAILSKTNEKISERIVQEVNDASDHDHVPSALLLNALLKARDQQISSNKTSIDSNKALIDGIKESVTTLEGNVTANTAGITSATEEISKLSDKVDAFTHLTIDVVIGAITDVQNPSTEILYLQKDDESATIWSLWIYRADNVWIRIGDTAIDLSGYWKKTEIDSIKVSIEVPDVTPMGDKDIQDIVEKVFGDTDPFAKKKYIVSFDESASFAGGDGEYTEGDIVSIQSDVGYLPKNSRINKWVSVDVVFDNPDAQTIEFIMPGHNVVISAILEYVLYIEDPEGVATGGTIGEDYYTEGTTVSIDIGTLPDERAFDQWKCDDPDVVFEDQYSGTTTLVMPAKSVKVIAVLKSAEPAAQDFIVTPANRSKIGYKGTAGEILDIPESFSENEVQYNVVGIGMDAFFNCKTLKSLKVPSTVTSIGDGAFTYCKGLETVELLPGLVSIGIGAFTSCDKITTINIPNSVTTIARTAFDGCISLATINVDNTVDSIQYASWSAPSTTKVNWLRTPSPIDFIITDKNRDQIGYSTERDKRDLLIPETFTGSDGKLYKVVGMDIGAFQSSVLTSVTVPKTITEIPRAAFNASSSLETVTLNDGITSIGHGSFGACTSLKSINIPNTVTVIEDSAFNNTALENINIPNSVTSIGVQALRSNNPLVINIDNTKDSISGAPWSNKGNVTVNWLR